MVDRYNLRNIVRYYDSSNFNINKLALGFNPPHPTFFVRSKVYQEHGLYNLNYKIAADNELITRFLYRKKISFSYIPAPLVIMRSGGISNGTIKMYLKNSKEIMRATKDNKLKPSIVKIYLRGIVKLYNMFCLTS